MLSSWPLSISACSTAATSFGSKCPLVQNIGWQLRRLHRIANAFLLMRLHPNDGLEPAGDKASQCVWIAGDKLVAGEQHVGEEGMNEVAEFHQQLAAAGFLQ